MTRITKTFTASENWTIPANAINIEYIIRGARGGHTAPAGNWTGGYSELCYGKGGYFGAQGQYLSGSLSDSYAGQSINFTRGLKGTDNNPSIGASEDSGTLGGAGVSNGGPGGIKPIMSSGGTLTCSAGGGAGGGGSSAFKTFTGTIMVEAGGGGGAGGCSRDLETGGIGVYPYLYNEIFQGIGIATTNITQNPRCNSSINNGWYTRTGSSENTPGDGVRTLVIKWQGATIYEGSLPAYFATTGELYFAYGNKGWKVQPSTYRPATGSNYGWKSDDSCGVGSPPFGDSGNAFDINVWRIPMVNYASGSLIQNQPDDEGDANYNSTISTFRNASNGLSGGQGSYAGNAGCGGGGGGSPGGTGGRFNPAGNQMPGHPGSSAGGYYNDSLVDSCTSTTIGYENWETQTFVDNGYAEISYEEAPEPTATLVSTSTAINRGQSITLTWGSTLGVTYSLTDQNGVVIEDTPGSAGSSTLTPPTGTHTYTYTVVNLVGTTTAIVTVVVTLLAPTASLTSNDTDNTIIAGESVTFTWEGLGFDITNYAMTGVVNPGPDGSVTVSPITDTIYTYTITNASGTANASISLTVYTPPTCTLSVDDNPLMGGNSTTLRWITTGDADTIQWTQGGNISAANEINGNLSINPNVNKTYQARVSGLGGTADSNELELVVVYLPIIHTWNVPSSYEYGSAVQQTFEYEYQYVNVSATVTFVYVYQDVNGNDVLVTQPNPISLPTSPGASGVGNDNRENGDYDYVPTWTEFGPRRINVTLTVSGNGGNITTTETITINIDELPNNINPEDSPDNLADQIVYTPNDEDTIISGLYRIDDIDIPVEIKSDHEIQVKINNVGSWNNVREL